jgi:hypothetical protein
MTKPYQNDYIDFDGGREGYVDSPLTATYVSAPKTASKSDGQRHRFSVLGEERLGSLIAATGAIWVTYVATVDYAALWRFQILPPGPLEVCALGILTWLHAKWRRSARVG